MKKLKNSESSLHSSKGLSKPLLSICVPIRNDLAMAKEFVKQMAEQTEEPEEVIFVDGYSTDGSYEFLEEASKKYKWLKVERLETDIVTASTGRNQAMRHSNGRFVYIVDVDIKIDKDFIRKMKKELSRCKEPIFFFNVRSYPSIEFKGLWHKLSYWRDNAQGILKGGPLVVLRRDALIFFKDRYFYGEDKIFYSQLMEKAKKGCAYSKETYWLSTTSVETFSEFFSRYFKYGFTSPEFVFGKEGQIIEKLKAMGTWLAVPLLPILFVGFAKGLYQTAAWRSFGREVILYPFIEMLVMLFFSLGFYARIFHEFLRLFGLRKPWNRKG